MKKLLLLVLLTVCLNISAQQTYVPDDNFEQALIDLGYDDVLDDYVLTANINGVTSLNVHSKGISDLTGIEDFTALTNLNCYSNQLTQLVLGLSPSLEGLWCDNNNLTNIDVTQCSNLEYLSCFYNQLTILDISQNINLWSLGCSDNQLTNIDISQNEELIQIHCINNLLSSLDVSNNQSLNFIACGTNYLIDLDVSQNLNLQVLNFRENQITNIDVTENLVLREFSFSKNQIEFIDLSNNINLEEVYAYENQLTNLDLSQTPNLKILWCYDNPLTSLNIKNGNNINMNRMFANNNPNLTCIQVDDEVYANNQICPPDTWMDGWCKDETAQYSENCPPIGLEEGLTNKGMRIYPNPTQNKLNIEATNLTDKNYTIYNIYGVTCKQGVFINNQIDISTLNSGIYLLTIDEVTFKIVKL